MLEGFTPAIVLPLENSALYRARVVFIALLNSRDIVRVSEHSRGKINTSRCFVGAHSARASCNNMFSSAISQKCDY